MGTRADFYYEDKNKKLKWIGSIGWDGYPTGVDFLYFGIKNVTQFKAEVKKFLSKRDDATMPNEGWPWPWETSKTTDYAYIFRKGKIYVSNFGSKCAEFETVMLLAQRQRDIGGALRAVEEHSTENIKKVVVEELTNLERKLGGLEEEAYEDSKVRFEFPDMTEIQNVSLGANSGLIVIRGAK